VKPEHRVTRSPQRLETDAEKDARGSGVRRLGAPTHSIAMEIEFRLHLPPFDSNLIEDLVVLGSLVFGQSDPRYVTWRLSHMPDVSAFCATSEGQLVGFKAGYAMTERKYYSWLGGVHPDFRRRGIASELMDRQHRWLVQRGYSIVETAANQENHAMAQANLRHGFSICGVRTEPQRIQILYSKSLR
jgi:ribosomal protein S18 acetylase RimI-like enzyme